jgi:hypothetical protein
MEDVWTDHVFQWSISLSHKKYCQQKYLHVKNVYSMNVNKSQIMIFLKADVELNSSPVWN